MKSSSRPSMVVDKVKKFRKRQEEHMRILDEDFFGYGNLESDPEFMDRLALVGKVVFGITYVLPAVIVLAIASYFVL